MTYERSLDPRLIPALRVRDRRYALHAHASAPSLPRPCTYTRPSPSPAPACPPGSPQAAPAPGRARCTPWLGPWGAPGGGPSWCEAQAPARGGEGRGGERRGGVSCSSNQRGGFHLHVKLLLPGPCAPSALHARMCVTLAMAPYICPTPASDTGAHPPSQAGRQAGGQGLTSKPAPAQPLAAVTTSPSSSASTCQPEVLAVPMTGAGSGTAGRPEARARPHTCSTGCGHAGREAGKGAGDEVGREGGWVHGWW